MNIKNLFNELLINSDYELIEGELTLKNKSIVWSYALEATTSINKNWDDDEDDIFDMTSNEESLYDIYYNDLEIIKNMISNIDEFNNLVYTDPEIRKNIISFKIQ